VAKTRVGACKTLKAARFDLSSIIAGGFTVSELMEAGFSVKVLAGEGKFDCAALYQGGASPYQLQRSGFSVENLKAAGVPQSEIDDLTKGGAGVGAELKALSFAAKLKKKREATLAAPSKHDS